jgi:hypothetical protein
MSITPWTPAIRSRGRFKHGSILGGKIRPERVRSQWKSTTQNATYQITPHDAGKLLLCTNGTRTWTLPMATDVWPGWTCRLRNRSGATLTLNTGAATDAINGGTAGVGITVATGSAILTLVCTGSTSFEVA